MSKSGFIQLHRQMLNWEWYDDVNVTRLFMHCLLRANHKTQKWRGITIERGTFITSLSKLSDETGLSIKQVRGALSKLKKTGELASHATNQNTVITVLNWDQYQEHPAKGTNQLKKDITEGMREVLMLPDDSEDYLEI